MTKSNVTRGRAHGTRTCYVWGPAPGPGDGCRCEPCRAANRSYVDHVTRMQLYGRWQPWASPETMNEVRDHLNALSSAGGGRRSIAAASGVSQSSIGAIRAGRSKVREQTAHRLLGVTTSSARDHAITDGTETRRLVDELVASGIPRYRIARAALGLEDAKALQLSERVLVRTARAIRHYHDHRWSTDPKLREVCRCFATITFERQRELDKLAKRQRRQAVPV